ncbi:MAG: SO2930 family diheme c-type cytochrome [Myxococcota bacterium]
MKAGGTLALLALVAASASCGEDEAPFFDAPVSSDVSQPPPMLLSELRLLGWDGERLRYNERVVPYGLNTPLFSDYSLKARAVYVPEGQTVAYQEGRPLDFPVGTVIVKTFYFPADFRDASAAVSLVETRVLRRSEAGWEAWPYVWNAEQTDAELSVAGDTRQITFIDEAGDEQVSQYLVPQRNQCSSCHLRGDARSPAMTPIGPAARHLNRDFDYEGGTENQLSRLQREGILTGLPELSAVPQAFGQRAVVSDEDVDRAARDYLDINCAHCHDPLGTQGVSSQLFLNHDSEDEFRLGVCKRPGSAGEGNGGLTYDIVPGSPDESILLFRVETTEVGAMMPLLGRSLQDEYGAPLLRRWIAQMEPVDCGAE